MIVKVTQEHIDKGRKVDYNVSICSNCPIAFALKDTFKVEEAFASYGYLRIGAFPENLIFEVNTPEQVVQWMLNFDTKNDKYIEDKDFNSYVQPFEFELSLEGVKL